MPRAALISAIVLFALAIGVVATRQWSPKTRCADLSHFLKLFVPCGKD